MGRLYAKEMIVSFEHLTQHTDLFTTKVRRYHVRDSSFYCDVKSCRFTPDSAFISLVVSYSQRVEYQKAALNRCLVRFYVAR